MHESDASTALPGFLLSFSQAPTDRCTFSVSFGAHQTIHETHQTHRADQKILMCQSVYANNNMRFTHCVIQG